MLRQPVLYAVGQFVAIVFSFQVILPTVPTAHGKRDFPPVFLLVVIPAGHLLVKRLHIFFHRLFQQYRNNLIRSLRGARGRGYALVGVSIKGFQCERSRMSLAFPVQFPPYLNNDVRLHPPFQHIQRSLHQRSPAGLAGGYIVFGSAHIDALDFLLGIFQAIPQLREHAPHLTNDLRQFGVFHKCLLIIGNFDRTSLIGERGHKITLIAPVVAGQNHDGRLFGLPQSYHTHEQSQTNETKSSLHIGIR